MNNLIDNRQIRVFISSTFQDMQDERDYLMKHTFPVLRKLASERDVTLTELDLRWGITEEEAKSGKVVEICFREIENCIPFFVGIIGNRYGWVPQKEDIGENVTDRFKEVNSYLERHLSVTDMEMQFGVLERKEDMHAYFYIFDNEEKAKQYEIDNPEMLGRLKNEVKASRYPSTTYSSPEDLGLKVQQAFTSLLDQLFPEGNLSELEKERIGQHSFLHQLCQNYIRDDRYFQVLDEWLKDRYQQQMVIIGESGLGKSALIANWLKEKLQDKKRKYNIIYHFIGNGGSESYHEHIMDALINEIKDVYGWEIGNDKPRQEKLNELFRRIAFQNRPLLLVLDAINQIIDVDNSKQLHWLPSELKNIKILFSTHEDDRTMEAFSNRNHSVLALQPLDMQKRRLLVSGYLKRLYGKSLSPEQVTRIVTDTQCENTLVLKTLLDELIHFGIHEKIDERIEYYLSKDTIEGFYDTLLQSYEDEFGSDLVKQFLTTISISRFGVYEWELLQVTNATPLYWSEFNCAFLPFFTTGNRLISFAHRHISEAVSRRYLISGNEYVSLFRRELLSIVSREKQNRAICETAFQLFHLGENESLYQHLKNNIDTLISSDEYYASLYFVRLLANKLCTLMEFIDTKPLMVNRLVFFFESKIIVEQSKNELYIILDFIKPYMPKINYYPSLIHILAQTYSLIDKNKAIELYMMEIDFYGLGILTPLPGYLKEEEQLEVWHEVEALKKEMHGDRCEE